MGTDEAYIRIGDDDGVGPIERVIAHGARLLLERLDETGQWDLPPDLYAVAQGPALTADGQIPEDVPDDIREDISSGMIGQQLEFAPLSLNPEVWTTAPPAEVLTKLARYARKHPPRLEDALSDGARIIGLLFASEAWAVIGPDDPDRVKDAARNRNLHQHPDRVELRLVYGVDRAGYHYSARQSRGSDEIAEHIQGPGLDDDGLERMSGEIPDALEDLLSALPDGFA